MKKELEKKLNEIIQKKKPSQIKKRQIKKVHLMQDTTEETLPYLVQEYQYLKHSIPSPVVVVTVKK